MSVIQGGLIVVPTGGTAGPPGPPGPPGPATTNRLNTYTATAGQTLFVLSFAPVAPTVAILTVNGVIYQQGVDYTLVGLNVTWLNTKFVLLLNDLVQVYYQ